MKKKLIIFTGLSVVSAGSVLAARALIKHLKNRAINKDRERLEAYVEKYLHGNEELLEFVGTLSDEQVKELLGILDAIQEKEQQLKIKSPLIPKILEKKVTNLIG